MTCWCSCILGSWCETVIALTASLGLASHTAVTGASWTVRGVSSIVLIVSVSPLCLAPFLIIYMEKAEPEPRADIHNSGLNTQFGLRFHFDFFLNPLCETAANRKESSYGRSRKIQSEVSQWCKTCSLQTSVHDNKVYSPHGVVEIWCLLSQTLALLMSSHVYLHDWNSPDVILWRSKRLLSVHLCYRFS